MHDVVIIGGGPAGLAAALYSARYGLDTVLFEGMYTGGQIVTAAEVENYPGVSSTSGAQLSEEMAKQAAAAGAKIIMENVLNVSLDRDVKTIVTSENRYETGACIIATGRRPKVLDLHGEDDLRGRGVSYCATCDGNFFRNKDVAVVGGGDTAIGDAAYLSRICRTVYLIHRRDRFRATKVELDKITGCSDSNVILRLESTISELRGKDMLEGVEIKDVNSGKTEVLPVSALFIAVGNSPNSELFTGKLDMDSSGYIVTSETMSTSTEGVYAAGDIRQKALYQVTTAVADGAIAAYSAERQISGRKKTV